MGSSSIEAEKHREVPEAPPEPLRFEDVYDTQFPFVWRAAQSLGVPEAALDDVVQEVFLVVYRRLEEFEGRAALTTWLYEVVLRVSRDFRRTQRRRAPHMLHAEGPADPDTLAASPDEGPHEHAAHKEAARVLCTLLDQLDDDKREVFVLAELEQAPASAIADALGVPVNTVYSRLRLARQAFDDALARHTARDQWRLR